MPVSLSIKWGCVVQRSLLSAAVETEWDQWPAHGQLFDAVVAIMDVAAVVVVIPTCALRDQMRVTLPGEKALAMEV